MSLIMLKVKYPLYNELICMTGRLFSKKVLSIPQRRFLNSKIPTERVSTPDKVCFHDIDIPRQCFQPSHSMADVFSSLH